MKLFLDHENKIHNTRIMQQQIHIHLVILGSYQSGPPP